MTKSSYRLRPAHVAAIATPPAPETLPAPLPGSRALAAIEDIPPPAPIDLHGFDPAAYEWVPRPRKPRKDGWSAEKQRLFIETLADTGLVVEAARGRYVAGQLLPSAPRAQRTRLRRRMGGRGPAGVAPPGRHRL